MFFFSNKKNTEKPIIQREPQFDSKQGQGEVDWSEKNPVEFLSMLLQEKNPSVKMLLIDTMKLKIPKSIALLTKAVPEFLMTFARQVDGRLFELANKSILLGFQDNHEDELQALLIRLQFLFNDEMAAAGKTHILDAEFVKIYETPEELSLLKNKVINFLPYLAQERKEETKSAVGNKFVSFLGSSKKQLKELSPSVLDKMQKSLLPVDFSSLIRRQAVCAVIGRSVPQMIFEEVYVSIPDLRDILLPDVDLTSNPWLFMHLTETLDKRVLAHVSQHDDGSLISNFSLNLNVSTILSDDFLAFDESIPAPLRSSIVLELQLVDIFNDVKAFLLAKAFAQYRGYKICIDGITVDKLKYINRENLNSDLMKIFWHPSFLDVINEDRHFRDYVNKAERAKMILCRVDDAKAIEVGNSIGINLYQGRYVQKELNKRRR